jgi:3-hydroxybutyryl-CoA dehydrogenase
MRPITKVAVVGGGLMGCGIAQVFAARDDWSVAVFDAFVPGDRIRERVMGNLGLLVAKEVLPRAEAERVAGRVGAETRLEDAAADADFVIECVPEDMELKRDLFEKLDRITRPEAILATNTSVMSPTEIASKASRRQRIVGTHFWNPPYLIPLVEVVKARDTSDATMDRTVAWLTEVGKKPIRCNKDVPGFVANRLQHALWREAISIVERGIADVRTVDEAVRLSFGLRLPVLGPLENADMVGEDLALSIHEYVLPRIESSPGPSPLLREMVARGELGFKSGKGFMEWTEEAKAASRKRLSDHLVRMLYGK